MKERQSSPEEKRNPLSDPVRVITAVLNDKNTLQRVESIRKDVESAVVS